MNAEDDFEENADQLFSDRDVDPDPYPAGEVEERQVYITPVDPDVRTLIAQITDHSLDLYPDFQRVQVWDRTRQSRLIESLLLNIPIPPCFLAEDEDGTRAVVDGRQRLLAIHEFCLDRYALRGLEVLSGLNGKRYSGLTPRNQRMIQQRVIRTIVVLSRSDPDIKYEIFGRLNTGGVSLTPQEIRNATLRGEFNALLDHLAHLPAFLRAIRRESPDPRLRHHELILRFFTLREHIADFKAPLRSALTDYMQEKRRIDDDEGTSLAALFDRALSSTIRVFGDDVFRRYYYEVIEEPMVAGQPEPQFTIAQGYEAVMNKAVWDVQMLSLVELPFESIEAHAGQIREQFEGLSWRDDEFSEALSRATDHRSRFHLRLRKWGQALKNLGLEPPYLARLPAD